MGDQETTMAQRVEALEEEILRPTGPRNAEAELDRLEARVGDLEQGLNELQDGRQSARLPTELGMHLIASAQEIPEMFAAMAKARAAFGAIKRSKTVQVQPKQKKGNNGELYWPKPYTFDYAPLESILDAVTKPLSDNGLNCFQYEAAGHLTTVLTHSSGGMWVHVTAIHSFNRVEDIKGYGSAVTYARRYAVGTILGISPEDDDDGNAAAGDSVEAQSKRQAPQQEQRQQKRRTAPEPEKAAPKTEAKQAPSPPKSESPPSPKPEAAGVTEATRDEIRALFPVLQKSGKAPEGQLLTQWLKEHCEQHCDGANYLKLSEEQAQTWLAALRETAK